MVHTAAIPDAVFELLPVVRANHPGAFDVHVQAFQDGDGRWSFAAEFCDDPTVVVDRKVREHLGELRRKRYLCRKTTYYFNEHGGLEGEPTTHVSPYR